MSRGFILGMTVFWAIMLAKDSYAQNLSRVSIDAMMFVWLAYRFLMEEK